MDPLVVNRVPFGGRGDSLLQRRIRPAKPRLPAGPLGSCVIKVIAFTLFEGKRAKAMLGNLNE